MSHHPFQGHRGAGLEFQDRRIEEARDDANAQGKMHNSRDGFGIVYRPVPRDIVRLCEEAKVEKGEVKI